MDNPNVLVYTTNKPYEADLLNKILSEEGINCFIINKMDSSYLFGDVEVFVEPDNVIRARLLIEKFEQT